MVRVTRFVFVCTLPDDCTSLCLSADTASTVHMNTGRPTSTTCLASTATASQWRCRCSQPDQRRPWSQFVFSRSIHYSQFNNQFAPLFFLSITQSQTRKKKSQLMTDRTLSFLKPRRCIGTAQWQQYVYQSHSTPLWGEPSRDLTVNKPRFSPHSVLFLIRKWIFKYCFWGFPNVGYYFLCINAPKFEFNKCRVL